MLVLSNLKKIPVLKQFEEGCGIKILPFQNWRRIGHSKVENLVWELGGNLTLLVKSIRLH